MSVQSVELLLDGDADAAAREQWDRLAVAGLPSQSSHAGQSNRPHVTVAVKGVIRRELDEAVARAVTELPDPLPLPVTLGGLLVFARRRSVLARAVVPSSALLELHARVSEVLAGCEPLTRQGATHFEPGRWTPHVTLARGLAPDQVGAAIAALAPVHEVGAQAVAVRRWDGAARRAWTVAGAS